MSDKLTTRERLFVDAYLGSCQGNATEAAAMSGYGKTRKSSNVLGTRLLAKVSIRQEVERRTVKRENKQIADNDERDRILTKLARRNISAKDRISAIKELNKCTGRHSMKHLHEGHLTLAQAIAASRRKP